MLSIAFLVACSNGSPSAGWYQLPAAGVQADVALLRGEFSMEAQDWAVSRYYQKELVCLNLDSGQVVSLSSRGALHLGDWVVREGAAPEIERASTLKGPTLAVWQQADQYRQSLAASGHTWIESAGGFSFIEYDRLDKRSVMVEARHYSVLPGSPVRMPALEYTEGCSWLDVALPSE